MNAEHSSGYAVTSKNDANLIFKSSFNRQLIRKLANFNFLNQ